MVCDGTGIVVQRGMDETTVWDVIDKETGEGLNSGEYEYKVQTTFGEITVGDIYRGGNGNNITGEHSGDICG